MSWFSQKKLSKDEAQALLLEGVRTNSLKKIDKALNAGADIDHHYPHITNSDGTLAYLNKDVSAVYIALLQGSKDIAMALLERGANPLEPACAGADSPIRQAVYWNAPEFIDAARARGYRLQDLPPTCENPIFMASDCWNTKALKALVAAGADVNTYDTRKTTPLYNIFWKNRNVDIPYWRKDDFLLQSSIYIQVLLDAGADIYARAPNDKVLLHTVRIKSHFLSLLNEHLDKLREGLTCEPGAGIEPQRLVQDGKPTTELLHYCGAHMLPQLFTEHRWKGKGGEALALFEEIKTALPDYYTPMLEAIDLTPLRREAAQKDNGPAVARYVRNRPPPEAERC